MPTVHELSAQHGSGCWPVTTDKMQCNLTEAKGMFDKLSEKGKSHKPCLVLNLAWFLVRPLSVLV